MAPAPRDPSPDVVIVGAGPTGLMAATLLRRAGVSVRILDKSAQQAHESRAFAVHARSLELLRSIGLGDAFMERGLIATGAQVFVEGRQVAEIDVADIGRHGYQNNGEKRSEFSGFCRGLYSLTFDKIMIQRSPHA